MKRQSKGKRASDLDLNMKLQELMVTKIGVTSRARNEKSSTIGLLRILF